MMNNGKIKYCVLSLLFACLLSCGLPKEERQNVLTEKEKKEGWILMFNGNDFSGWRQYRGIGMPGNWIIEDGCMKVFTAEGRKWDQGAGGDIIYDRKKFKDFELSLEWKNSPCANSGIMYYVHEDKDIMMYQTAPEVQIYDNTGVPGLEGIYCAGALYDLLPADSSAVNAVGEWNRIIVRVKDGKAAHWLNGKKIVEYTLWTPEWNEMIKNSKFFGMPDFITPHDGYIGLQDHGCPVWFRNIKIREL